MRVLLSSISPTTSWWRYLCEHLSFATSVRIVSEVPDGDLYLVPDFYRHLKARDIDEAAYREVGEADTEDVIRRCRLLRVLDQRLAVRMVGAMWRTIEQLVDRERPDLVLSFQKDRFSLDLLERSLIRRGVPFVGLTISMLPEYLLFILAGEYPSLREPDEEEVDRMVALFTQPDFLPTYVRGLRFSARRFFKEYCFWTARWLAFEVIKTCRRNPLDWRYLTARYPDCGYRVRLKDYRVTSFMDSGWKARLDATAFEKRVFVGLAVTPEAAIDYWVPSELLDYYGGLLRAIHALDQAGYVVFVKDHPNNFALCRIEIYEALARFHNVVFVPYSVPGRLLIRECKTTLTWSGTVGFEAALLGRCAVVAGGVYYVLDDLFVVVHRPDDLDRLPERIEAFRPGRTGIDAQRAIMRNILRSSGPGDYFSWRGFRADDPAARRRADTVIPTLNQVLPELVSRDRVRSTAAR